MRRLESRLSGLALLAPEVHADERGFFLETFHAERYAEMGISAQFVQDNQSRSQYGAIRGLHFQAGPGQAKIVRVARGRIWDVVVDIRPDSDTFGSYEAFELDDVKHLQLYVPVGFAHGFCVLSSVADVTYKVSNYYQAALELGIAWDDPALGIPWPVTEPTLSSRDRSNPRLAAIAEQLGRS